MADFFLDDGLIFNGNSYNGVTFKNLRLDGVATFTNCEFIDCYIENINGISGEMVNCRLKDNIIIEPGKSLSGVEMVIEGDFTTIDLGNTSGTTFSADINSGYLLFINSVDGCLIELNEKGGEVELDNSITGGDIYLEGIGTLFGDPEALGMTVKGNHLLALETIPVYIWNEQLSGYTINGSSGKALSNASTGGVDYGILASAVWSELLNSPPANDTAAFILKQIATLAEQVHKIHGLDISSPVTVTQTKRIAGSIDQNISTTGQDATQQTIITRN